MKRLSLDNPDAFSKQLEMQRKHAWDLDTSIDWDRGIDLDRPLLPLDRSAVAFPGASSEERLAISQLMGLTAAFTTIALEEALVRLQGDALNTIHHQRPVGPEFEELGELFFEEEQKHSKAFRRYGSLFCETAGIDEDVLLSIMPSVSKPAEAYMRFNIKRKRMTFWWIVAFVEQQFLSIYHSIAPFKSEIDPLYFEVHRRHFEEEARHASFPYMVIDLMTEGKSMRANPDLLIAQMMQVMWVSMSSINLLRLKKVHKEHPMLDILYNAMPLLRKQPMTRLGWKFATEMPYLSGLMNPTAHQSFERYRIEKSVPHVPFPQHVRNDLVSY